jgi:hypothetical protein
MSDPIAPPAARHPAEAAELVALAIAGGDLQAALAQYEPGASLQPWAAPEVASGGSVRTSLAAIIELRLPVTLTIRGIEPAGGIWLVSCHRVIAGRAPDCEQVDLRGLGTTIVRAGPGGLLRIARDEWRLASADGSWCP